ncbi:uncharacterized protein [Nicotiana tomentosiformis]|uniref:uncharacterized protein isoform X1 n=1 Tax=Nicotiana tomentosiformis TaxID=4098 RepID=UPI00051C169C|nr:E3 ubiquitin-protein ligase SIRP1-like isoform X1 [Nicotiana tomentosiformis]XP_018629534.1 E3 ubiquitin-protein ligase SIRP1-like isoform X1 [Nicotiana tomentosiformis]XP_018629535.1 E3 ubiquitin-protein ligase SIRP1-like isoform X1 [Nicotiana tomentosiformis]XP_018629537.1 E3 ubiquitin-protein ligase SIRP1-like isoform X1 [Nicotiana tomentosiformis]XP_033514471.1 E3 ubiquitin-protein ligase SIRP1-like isoform X1 [Nicotiana tomentosiformis]XP_033514472.1 E3 ubiquitin-protein ligase SIRP1-l
MESSNSNAENSTFSGTLNASANSTPTNMPRNVTIQSHIEEVQAELGQSDRASAEFMSNQEDVNDSSHAEFCLVCQRMISGSATLNSLLEHTHDILSANAGGGERTADVIDSSTQTMIPESEGELEEEGENDGQNPTIDNELLMELELYEHMRNVIAALRHTTFPLYIKLHKYDSSTCLECKEQCCICLDEYWDGEELAKIDCGHVYHINCIKEWIKSENSCPICRRLAMVR